MSIGTTNKRCNVERQMGPEQLSRCLRLVTAVTAINDLVSDLGRDRGADGTRPPRARR